MSNTVARNQKPANVADVIRSYAPLIQQALPEHLSVERFSRLSLTTLRRTPKLQQCNPESFVGAILTAASLGLEPDVNGEAYLVPYGREAQLIVGYQGIAKLFWQHPLAARLDTQFVCENDDFSYSMGLTPSLHHVPATGDRGAVTHFYAVVGVKGREPWFEVMTVEQVAKVRKVSTGEVLGTKKRDVDDPQHWMSRKTVLKQALKLAPKSTQLAQAYEVDEQPGSMHKAQIVSGQSLPEIPAGVDADTGEMTEVPEGQMFAEPEAVKADAS